jgi:LacI family transcriptional regulator
MVTQDKIAKRLGMSRISVARALNGYGKVSAENRRRIEEVARELGYDTHTNRAAREMAARRYGRKLKTDVVAVFLPPRADTPLRAETFFSPLLDGIEMRAEELGLDVFIHSQRTGKQPRLVQNGGVDGVICLASAPDDLLKQFKALHLPVVTLSVLQKGAYGIAPNDHEGTRLATQHLIDSRHRSIAYLGHQPNFSASVGRIEGFKSALESNGLPVDEQLVEATLWSPRNGAEGVARLLARDTQFTALVCHNDLIAMGAIRELEQRGLRVPQDVSVAGFDDISTQQHFVPALTSVAFDREAMGRRAVEVLRAADASKKARHEVVPVELVVRDSTKAVV